MSATDQPSGGEKQERSMSGRGIEAGIDRLERVRASKHDARVAGDLRGQKARNWTEKLLARTTSGAIYLIVTVGCLFWGIVPTALLVSAMAWLCCSEFFRMARMSGRMPNEVFGLTATVLFTLAPLSNDLMISLFITLFLMVACAAWYVLTPRANISDVAITAFGPLYTGLMFSSVVMIRHYDAGLHGFLLAFGVISSVWLNDVGAYFIGSRFGKHKLAPRISPKKSVEGLLGGLLFCILVWVALYTLKIAPLTLPLALGAGLLVGVVSVVGDLFESRIKRGVGVKDSGNAMPGHGGLLDRSDSMLFGASVAFLLLRMGGIL